MSTPAPGDEGDKYAQEDFSKYLPESAKRDQPTQRWELPSDSSGRMGQCFQRIKTGAMLGAALGGSFGFLYGCYAAIAYRHILYVPISVIQAGFGFGLFLACGMVIRCDEGPHALTHTATPPLPSFGQPLWQPAVKMAFGMPPYVRDLRRTQ